ncbi:hypothetical protein CIB48_g2856 [Xylaria polymorpha]|nr:hypothetical protein CIB48_g2856 [Xylaria polymorpha]
MRAWRLLYELMRDKHPEAAHLLLIMGSMNVQCIPNSFFERGELYTQVRQLVDYGIVEPSADGMVITVTAIIRECVQKCLDDEGDRDLIEEQVLSVLCNKVHGDEHRAAEVLLPCALAALKFQSTSTDIKLKLANLNSEVAKLYGHTKQDQLAVDHWKQAISLYKEDPESNHKLLQGAKEALREARVRVKSTESDTKATGKTAAGISSRVAKEKEELLACEKSAGEHHPDTIRKASEFAKLQLMHGGKSEAQASAELYQRVLEWCEEKQGDNSIDVGRQQFNLALARERQGEYDEAEKLYQSALRIAGSHLSPGNPELLRILANLASLYCKQGRREVAAQALRATFLGQQKALGGDHPDTLKTRQNIAIMMGDEGQVDAAVDELEDVLRVQIRLLGRDNPATLQTAFTLAVHYSFQGLCGKAESLLPEPLGVQRRL